MATFSNTLALRVLGTLFRMKHAALLAMLVVLPRLLGAQTNGKSAGLNACQLLSTAEVERVTGQKGTADPLPSAGGAGCLWDSAQLHVVTDNLEQRIDTMTKSFGQRGAKPVPIQGLGEKALSFAPEPRDKYDDRVVYVVVKQGRYLVQTSVLVPKGKSAQAVQPQAVELAKLVLPKLR